MRNATAPLDGTRLCALNPLLSNGEGSTVFFE